MDNERITRALRFSPSFSLARPLLRGFVTALLSSRRRRCRCRCLILLFALCDRFFAPRLRTVNLCSLLSENQLETSIIRKHMLMDIKMDRALERRDLFVFSLISAPLPPPLRLGRNIIISSEAIYLIELIFETQNDLFSSCAPRFYSE